MIVATALGFVLFFVGTSLILSPIGVAISGNIGQFNLTAEELAFVAAGLRDGALGNTLKVDMQTYGPRIQLLADERTSAASGAEKTAAEAWLAEQAALPNAQRSPMS